jgi:hypothetical protein
MLAGGRALTSTQMKISALRNFDSRKTPRDLGVGEFNHLIEETYSRIAPIPLSQREIKSSKSNWALLIVNGMWFQDAFNYDTRASEASGTPVATQEGEIPFCAYNSANWRKIVEHKHMTASLSDWNKKHGRHPIYANGKFVQIGTTHAVDAQAAPENVVSLESKEVVASH